MIKKIINSKYFDKSTLKESIFLIFISILLAITLNSIHGAGINVFKKCDKNKSIRDKIHKKKNIKSLSRTYTQKLPINFNDFELEINLETAYRYFNMGLTFIDARETTKYIESHIKNSFSFPTEFADTQLELIFDKYSKETPLILYCSGPDCSDSHILADMLLDAGFLNIKVFEGGLPEWLNNSYPIDGRLDENN